MQQTGSIIMDGQTTLAPKVVNGINLDDLFALIERVKSSPAEGMTRWRVTSEWQGQTRSRAEVEGFELGGAVVPAASRSTLMSHASLAARTAPPIRRNI
jgi:hypothetical protein